MNNKSKCIIRGSNWRLGFLWDWRGYWIDDIDNHRNYTYLAVARRKNTKGLIIVVFWLYISFIIS